MRVGLVCPYSLSLPGGVQGQVLGLGEALRRQGVDARVLGPCDGPPPDAEVTPLGNSVPYATNGSMAAIAPDPAAALRTIRALRDEEFDVVHLHEPLAPGPTLTALAFADGPMVATFHRSGESAYYHLVRPLTTYVSHRVTVRTAVSAEAEATARAVIGGQDYERVWNGIDASIYDRAEPWPAPAGRRTMIFVGRHEVRKGLAVLMEAMASLPADVTLWVVGEGPDTARLRSATRDDGRIEWLGTVGEAEKIRRMRAADVLCAPSLSGESFGVVLLEGMAASCAVVATDLSGYRQVARDGEEALLVPAGDAAGLAAALRIALDGGPEIAAMVAAGHARTDDFSLDRLAVRYRELYEQAIAAPSDLPPGGPARVRRLAEAINNRLR